MKKTFKLFVSAVAAMATLAGCAKNEISNQTPGTKTVQVVAKHGDTKTTLLDSKYVRWSATDAIKAYGYLDNYVSTSTEVTDGGATAKFTFDLDGDEIVYMIYPATAAGELASGDAIHVTIPTEQTAVANGFADGANVAIGAYDNGTAYFYSIGALVSFDIKNDNITSIKLECPGATLTGKGEAALESTDVIVEGDAPADEGTADYVLIKAAAGQTLTNGAKYFAVVYAGDYTNMKITFTRNDGKTATYTNPNKLELEANSNFTIFNAQIPDSKWQGAAPSGDKFVKLNSVDELEDNMEVVIVAHDVTTDESASDTYYAIPVNPTVSSGKIAGGEVKVVDSEISATDAEGYVWTLEKSGDFYVLSDGSKNLYHTNGGASDTNLTYGESQTLLWDIKAAPADATEGTFKFAGVSQTTVNNRGLLFNKTVDKFGGYALSNISNTQYCGIDVYKKNGSSAKKYSVSCATVDGGTLSATPAKAEAGATVTLTATPASEESTFNNDWSVKGADNTPVTVTGNTFVMPAQNVTVTGSFSVKTYTITKTTATNGSFTVKIGESEVSEAVKGARITLSAEPAELYKFDGFTVKETVSGNPVTVSNNIFTMPAAAVTVSAAFSEKPVGPTYEGSGTEEDPYTINDAYMLIDDLGTASSDEVCVTGKIYQIDSYSTQYKSITYWIGSSEKPLEVYSGKNLNNTDFASKDDLNIGDEVVIKGNLKKYNSTYEFDKNNYIVSLKKASYLKASASKKDGLSADGETVTVNVDTNVEGWTASSDNADFSISGKTTNSFQVVVSKNSTSAARTAKITVSATGVNSVVITLTQSPAGETHGWVRCTSVADITSGGKFIIGYEATANSGKLIPMKNNGGTATLTAAGYMANGSEIDMATITATSDYEFTIEASTSVTGAVCIKCGNSYIGNTNTKNNLKLFEKQAATTAFGVTVGTNDVFTFKIAANASYHTLQYNTGSPRFAVYGGAQKNLVLYKYK